MAPLDGLDAVWDELPEEEREYVFEDLQEPRAMGVPLAARLDHLIRKIHRQTLNTTNTPAPPDFIKGETTSEDELGHMWDEMSLAAYFRVFVDMNDDRGQSVTLASRFDTVVRKIHRRMTKKKASEAPVAKGEVNEDSSSLSQAVGPTGKVSQSPDQTDTGIGSHPTTVPRPLPSQKQASSSINTPTHRQITMGPTASEGNSCSRSPMLCGANEPAPRTTSVPFGAISDAARSTTADSSSVVSDDRRAAASRIESTIEPRAHLPSLHSVFGPNEHSAAAIGTNFDNDSPRSAGQKLFVSSASQKNTSAGQVTFSFGKSCSNTSTNWTTISKDTPPLSGHANDNNASTSTASGSLVCNIPKRSVELFGDASTGSSSQISGLSQSSTSSNDVTNTAVGVVPVPHWGVSGIHLSPKGTIDVSGHPGPVSASNHTAKRKIVDSNVTASADKKAKAFDTRDDQQNKLVSDAPNRRVVGLSASETKSVPASEQSEVFDGRDSSAGSGQPSLTPNSFAPFPTGQSIAPTANTTLSTASSSLQPLFSVAGGNGTFVGGTPSSETGTRGCKDRRGLSYHNALTTTHRSYPKFSAGVSPTIDTTTPPDSTQDYFTPHREREHSLSSTVNHYQNLHCQPAFEKFSSEEQRLEDYARGMRYGAYPREGPPDPPSSPLRASAPIQVPTPIYAPSSSGGIGLFGRTNTAPILAPVVPYTAAVVAPPQTPQAHSLTPVTDPRGERKTCRFCGRMFWTAQNRQRNCRRHNCELRF